MITEQLEGRRLMAFTEGNLLVLQVGDGAAALAATGSPVTLKEFTVSGVAERTVPIPSTGSTRLTNAGNATSEGNLALSADGRYVTFVGYDAVAGTAGVASSTTINRLVGLIDGHESIDLTTSTTSFSGTNIRSATTIDGTRLWAAGASGGTAGLRTTTLGSTGAMDGVAAANYRVAQIFSDQLYVSTAGSIFMTTPALPTGTATPTALSLTGGTTLNNIYDFVFLDRDPVANGSGYDTLYIADASAGIVKYSSVDGVSWTQRGAVTTMRGNGLEAIIEGTSVVIFGTNNQSAGNRLQRFIDTAAYDATITPSAIVDIATAPANTAFRGISLAPSTGVFSIPTVASPTASNVGTVTATLSGQVTSSGGTALTARGIVYSSTNSTPTLGGSGVSSGTALATGTGQFSVDVSGLTSGTTYFYRTFATNSQGTAYSDVVQFTTASAVVAPTITSPTQAAITDVSALLGGNVTADGGAALSDRGIVLAPTATNANPTIGGAGVIQVSADTIALGVFTKVVSGLTPSTNYSFAAYAINSAGTSYTSVGTFTTANPATAPILDAASITDLSDVFARAAGSITSDGGASITARGFVYALTATNSNPQIGGTGVRVQNVAGTTGAMNATLVGANVGLLPGSNYSIVAYATNSLGTTYSPVVTFTTAATIPLAAGDIAFTGYSGTSSVERVSFVALASIATGTSIVFTDGAFDGNTQTFSTNEGFYALQFTQAFPAGSRFYYDSSTGFRNFDGTSTGLVTVLAGNLGLNNSGDQFTAIQGAITSPTSYLAQISSPTFLTTGTVSTTSTYIAPGLVEGETAISLGSGSNNGVLDSTNAVVGTEVTGTPAQIRSIVSNVSNWVVSTSTALVVPPAITFTPSASGLADPTVTVNAVPAEYTGTGYVGASFTLSGAASPTPTVTFTFYAGNSTAGAPLATAPINAGTYTVVASSEANAGNNAATSAPATFTITPKALAVVANALVKRTGSSDPVLTFSADGFVPTDSAATALMGTLSRDPGEVAGSYTIRQGSLAAVSGNYAISFTNNTLTILDPVALSGQPQINGGAAQRSQLTSLTVSFNSPVTLSAGAFSITNIGLTTPESIALAQSQILVSPAFGTASQSFTVTFGDGAGVVTRGQASGGNSLVDGNYTLTIDPAKVVDVLGGNLTGSTSFGAAAVDKFFRLFGDADGTGAVDATDLNAWRRAATVYNPIFDANGDGVINGVDGDVWKPNYGKRRRIF